MRLTLTNFGKYSNFTLVLPESALVCLIGQTGCGKTTIFDALVWLCTGEAEEPIKRGIPRQAKVIAQLEWRDLLIRREKRPEQLLVTSGGYTYQSSQAEALLRQIFGSERSWYASSYLMQERPHKFLTANAKERVALLKDCAMALEDPSPYIARVAERRRAAEFDYTAQYTQSANAISRWRGECNALDWSHELTAEIRTTLRARLTELPNLIAQQQRAVEKLCYLDGQISQLTQQIAATQLSTVTVDLAALNAAVATAEKELRQAELLQTSLVTAQNAYARARALDAQLAATADLPELPNASLQLYQQLNEQTNAYQQATATCQQLGLSYDAATIAERKKLLQAWLLYAQTEPLRTRISELTQSLTTAPPAVAPTALAEMATALAAAEQAARALSCPSCAIKLRLTAGRLEVWPTAILDHSAIAELRQKLLQAQQAQAAHAQWLRTKQTISELEQQIAGRATEPVQLPTMTIAKAQAELLQLSQLRIVAAPELAPTIVQRVLERNQLRAQRQNLFLPDAKILETAVVDCEKLRATLRTAQAAESAGRQTLVKFTQLQEWRNTLARLQNERELCQDPRAQLIQLQNEMNRVSQQLAEQQTFDRLRAEQQQLEHDQQRLTTLQDLMHNWTRIHLVMVEAEYQMLLRTVALINAVLAKAMAELFDNLHVEIKLFTEENRPAVHLRFWQVIDSEILECTAPKISGGERARLSLALLLGFHSVTQTPWLLLDETFASLNIEHCERARMAITHHLDVINASCYVIAHNDNTGRYDHTLNLNTW